MDEMINPHNIFNTHFEAALRSLVFLNESYPMSYDLTHLTWFDHLIVHTGDIPGGPISLHPDIPQRTGELLVRRRIVEDGLNMLIKLHLVEMHPERSGIKYIATDRADPFVNLIQTKYGLELIARSKWLVNYLKTISDIELRTFINDKIGQWSIEFQNTYSSKSESRI